MNVTGNCGKVWIGLISDKFDFLSIHWILFRHSQILRIKEFGRAWLNFDTPIDDHPTKSFWTNHISCCRKFEPVNNDSVIIPAVLLFPDFKSSIPQKKESCIVILRTILFESYTPPRLINKAFATFWANTKKTKKHLWQEKEIFWLEWWKFQAGADKQTGANQS